MASISWTLIRNAVHTWIRVASGLSAERIRWAGQNAPEVAVSTTLPWILIGRLSATNPGADWSEFESNPFVFDDKTITLDDTTDEGTSVAHDLLTRDGPFQIETTGSLAGTGLAIETDYWCVKTGDDTLRFAESFPDADTGVYVDILAAGTGVHTLVCTDDTRRAGEELTEYIRGGRRITFDVQCFPPTPSIGTQISDDSDPVAVLSDVEAKSGLGAVADALAEAGIAILDAGEPRAIDGILNSVYFEPRAIMTVVLSATSQVSSTETIIDYVHAEEDPGDLEYDFDLTEAPESL
jgi:hypothetical protein